MDYKSLLHRYMWHVGKEEGCTFIPSKDIPIDDDVLSDGFTDDEVDELSRMDKEKPQ